MDQSATKLYYKIGDVSEMLGVPISTLRFWETKFPITRPRRTGKGTRQYTPDNIEAIRMVRFLVKEKGLKIEAAQEEIRINREGISRRVEALTRLRSVRDRIQELIDSLHKLR